MVKNATLGVNSAQQIVGETTQNLNDAVLAQLPKLSILKQKLRRLKECATWLPPCPTSIRDLIIPDQYKCLSDGSQFLLHDSGVHDDERFIIVGSMTGLRALSMSTRWHADGTFKTTPLIFKQLQYSIHSEIGNNSLVAVLDLELTAINAFTYVYPSCKITACFFHVSQCLWRKIQQEGLQTLYSTNVDFAVNAKMLAALAFIPLNDVVKAFEELVDYLPEFILPVVDYFEDNLSVGRPMRRTRQTPKFQPKLWDLYEAAIHGLARNKNGLEGWHNGFQKQVGGHHVSI
ncbi:hypothetical protein ACI65C_007553 [Semiaphis heraclei]